MSFLFQPFMAGAARVRDRLLGNLKVHPGTYKMIGQRTEPALLFEGIWVENTGGQEGFVSDYVVELKKPVSCGTRRTEWRERGRPVPVAAGTNVGRFQKTDLRDVIVHLDGQFETASGSYKGTIFTSGREGFRAKATAIGGDYGIADG